MAFDVAAALKAGYSEEEIALHLGAKAGFDAAGALDAGYSPNEIIGKLNPTGAGGGRGFVNPHVAVEDMSAGTVAQDVVAGGMKIGPTVVKGLADLAQLATGGRVGKDTSEYIQRGMDAIDETVGSDRALQQKQNFQADMANDGVSFFEALANNKGALADQLLPTVGSMFVPVGAAAGAGKLATMGKAASLLDEAALAARVAKATTAAGMGATAAQNAADTYVTLREKGASQEDAYKGAALTVPFTLAAGKLTGGGAEGAIIRQLEAGVTKEALKRGAMEVPKAMLREGGQEMGEEAGQISGEALGTGQAPTAAAAAKRMGVAGTLGAAMGGGVNVAQQAAAVAGSPGELSLEDALIQAIENKQTVAPTAPKVEDQPTTPQAPVVPKAPQVTDPIAPMDDNALLNAVPLEGGEQVQRPAQSAAVADEGAGVSQPTQAAAPKAVQSDGSVIPEPVDPVTKLRSEIEQIKAKAQQEIAAKQAEAEKAAAQVDPKAFAQSGATPAALPGAVPDTVNRPAAAVQAAQQRQAKYGDLSNQAVYPERALYGIINNPQAKPELKNAARSEVQRRRDIQMGRVPEAGPKLDFSPKATAVPTMSPAAQQLQARMGVQNANTTAASAGLDQRAQPSSGGAVAFDQRGAGVPVSQTINGQPGVPGGAFALRGNEATGDATPRSQPLKLAKTAPVNALNWFKKVFDDEFKTDVSPYTGPLSPRQQAASAIAALQGKTLTFLSDKTGNNRSFANGVAMGLGGKHIAINADSTDDSPMLVAMHEVFHTLPVDLRSRFSNALVKQMSEEGTYDAGVADFLQKFDYEAKDVGEELPAFVVQLIGKRQSFWEGMRDKLGEGDFKSVVQHLLKSLRAYVFGVKDAYGDAFAKKYLGDLSKLEGILQDILIENNWEMEGSGQVATQTQAEPEAVFARRTSKTERIGEFDVTPAKNGTLFVHGAPAAIRAKMPEGVVGRAASDGVAFTNADAPRVRGALSGSNTAYSRAGQVVDKLPMRNGKYLGAPEKFDTPAKIPRLRKWLRQLAEEGAPGRFWYENSSAAILQMTGGDVQEARRFVALLAIYSPQAKVDANSTFALRAWSQYKMGQPISVKTGVMDSKAQRAMDDVDEFWSGEKTGNFFTNLLSEIDPNLKGKQGATIDMWMMRAGQYSSDAPTKTQYAFMENETNRLAQELGWDPHQVQAAIWVAMKARMENAGVKKRTEAISEKKGWMRYDYPLKNGNPRKTRVVVDDQKHRDNWLDQAFKHDPTKDDTEQAKFDFSDGVRRHIGQVSWEPRPSTKIALLPNMHSAPYEQQLEFFQAVQKALQDENGADLLAQQLGLLVDDEIQAPGVWESEISAGGQKLIAMAPAAGGTMIRDFENWTKLTEKEAEAIDPNWKKNPRFQEVPSLDRAQETALRVYSAMLGMLLRQDGVGYHRPFYSGKKTQENGAELRIGKPFTQEQAKELWTAMDAAMRDKGVADWEQSAGMISSPQGMRVVNFGAMGDNVAFQRLVESVANGLSFDVQEQIHFTSDGDLVSNDWRENPNGAAYETAIRDAGRSDLLGWGRDVLAPRIQAVFNDFSERYNWGDPGQPVFSKRARDGLGSVYEERGPSARPHAVRIDGTHFSKNTRTSLDGRYFGQGLKGAEQSRLAESTDPRIKERVYFYVDEGKGVTPESGVGGVAHAATVGNLYNVQGDPLKLFKANDINGSESRVLDAGYDGYYFPNYVNGQGIAIVMGNASRGIKVEPTEYAKGQRQTEPEPPYKRGLMSRELNKLDLPSLRAVAPSAKVSAGTLQIDRAELDAARAELTKQGIDLPEDGPVFSRKQTETPEFKRWFGDSKVVDAEGKPEVFYHGTSAKFHAFRDGDPIFMYSSKEMAENYGNRVLPLYASIRKLAWLGEDEVRRLQRNKKELEALKTEGYDGAIADTEDGDQILVAFNPTQIKSATGNNGQFDSENPDIYFSRKAQDTRDLDQDIVLEIPVEGGGTAKLTVNAKTYLDQLDRRQEALEMVKECML